MTNQWKYWTDSLTFLTISKVESPEAQVGMWETSDPQLVLFLRESRERGEREPVLVNLEGTQWH